MDVSQPFVTQGKLARAHLVYILANTHTHGAGLMSLTSGHCGGKGSQGDVVIVGLGLSSLWGLGWVSSLLQASVSLSV